MNTVHFLGSDLTHLFISFFFFFKYDLILLNLVQMDKAKQKSHSNRIKVKLDLYVYVGVLIRKPLKCVLTVKTRLVKKKLL